MATAGFFVRNDFGTVQVDQNWQNFMLRQRYDFPIGHNSDGGAVYRQIQVTVPGGPSAIFATTTSVIGAPDFYAPSCTVMKAVPNSNGTWTLHLHVMNRTGSTILGQIYIFDVGYPPNTNGNMGLAIWNEVGQLVFHSSGLPLRVTNWAADGRKYAIINNMIGVLLMPSIQGQAGTGAMIRLAFATTTQGPYEKQVYVQPRDGTSYSKTSGDYLVIDVTDFD